MHILDQLMKSVVRIEAHLSSGEMATGSGFATRLAVQEDGKCVPVVITNKHVIDNATHVSIPISTADMSGTPTGSYELVKLEIGQPQVIMHPSESVDLCAILTAPILNYFSNKQLQAVLPHLDMKIVADDAYIADLLPLEEVTMIGFPNGIWDSVNNGAIARRGVIATIPKDDYLGKKQFVIDMACFPGSSGSPVFLANFNGYTNRAGVASIGCSPRVMLLGILYAGPQHTVSGEIIVAPVPTANKPMAITSIPNNLGYVIKASEIVSIDRIAQAMV